MLLLSLFVVAFVAVVVFALCVCCYFVAFVAVIVGGNHGSCLTAAVALAPTTVF